MLLLWQKFKLVVIACRFGQNYWILEKEIPRRQLFTTGFSELSSTQVHRLNQPSLQSHSKVSLSIRRIFPRSLLLFVFTWKIGLIAGYSKVELFELGSAHEWSGVWTGPKQLYLWRVTHDSRNWWTSGSPSKIKMVYNIIYSLRFIP